MKINKLLESTPNKFEHILNTKYFNTFIKPKFDEIPSDFFDEDEASDHYEMAFNKFSLRDVVLLHGTRINAYETGQKIPISPRKYPTDTAFIAHKYTNLVSQEKFGVGIRDLMFATKSLTTSNDYGKSNGNIFITIPSDDYKFYYSDQYEDYYLDFLKENFGVRSIISDMLYEMYSYIVEITGELKEVLAPSIQEYSDTNNQKVENVWQMLYSEFEGSISQRFKADIHTQFLNDTMSNLLGKAKAYNERIYDELSGTLYDENINEPKGFKKQVTTIIQKIYRKYLSLIEYHFTDLAEDYIETINVTTHVGEIVDSFEIMIDATSVHMVAIDDIAKLFKAYRNSTK